MVLSAQPAPPAPPHPWSDLNLKNASSFLSLLGFGPTSSLLQLSRACPDQPVSCGPRCAWPTSHASMPHILGTAESPATQKFLWFSSWDFLKLFLVCFLSSILCFLFLEYYYTDGVLPALVLLFPLLFKRSALFFWKLPLCILRLLCILRQI